ncbi:MAG: hypothetical protein ACYS30_13900 [Planctomycetota bacterium]
MGLKTHYDDADRCGGEKYHDHTEQNSDLLLFVHFLNSLQFLKRLSKVLYASCAEKVTYPGFTIYLCPADPLGLVRGCRTRLEMAINRNCQ